MDVSEGRGRRRLDERQQRGGGGMAATLQRRHSALHDCPASIPHAAGSPTFRPHALARQRLHDMLNQRAFTDPRLSCNEYMTC